MPSTRIILKPFGAVLVIAAFGVVATIALLKGRAPVASVTPSVATTPIAPVAVPITATHLKNGDMESGADIPTGWDSIWTGTGRVKAVRDTVKRNSGSASLRLESVGNAPAYASTSQDLTGLAPGQTIKISVAGCAEGKLDEAFITLQAFDPTLKRQLSFDAVAKKEDLVGKDGFTTYTRDITLPKEPFTARLVVLMKGSGKIWADDISITATK